MAFPHAHKTVIVADHGPHFAESCKQPVEFDVLFNKNRVSGIIPLSPVMKSLWTCNVEAILEYCRIVFDICPRNKLIRLITSDTAANTLNTWKQQDQLLNHLLVLFSSIKPPLPKSRKADYNIMHGLVRAVEVLCEASELQHKMRTSLSPEDATVINRGRVICLTTLKSDAHVRTLEECVLDTISQHNKLSASSDNLIPIDHCELVLVHIVPVGEESTVTGKPKTEISPLLTSEVHVTQSGNYIALKLMELVQQHFDLFSTTVTGIPMKEEQNASSSANYDVELLHSADAHREIMKSDHQEGVVIQSKEGLPTMTVGLKWCTPKSNVIELQNCLGAYRVTPVDVNSRPSQCLTNFLLSGRAVMLEQPRKGGRVMSHMLASHGGELYIHVLSIARSALEDPPSISEGAGGRVTDYRIQDFGDFMKENRLAPAKPGVSAVKPIELAKTQLERMTRHWPIVISNTIIFNMVSHLDPLPSLIVKEVLEEDEVLECKKAIYHVVGMESRNDPLPVPTLGTRGKGPKRDEQYRQMWSELEMFVRAHSGTSANHNEVLKCLLDCKRPEEGKGTGSPLKVKEEKIEPSQQAEAALRDYEKYQKLSEREKLELNKVEIKDSPDSPPPEKQQKITHFGIGKHIPGPQSLLSLWTNRLKSQSSKRHKEFDGRLESDGPQAELYIHMKEELQGNPPDGNFSQNKGTGTSKSKVS